MLRKGLDFFRFFKILPEVLRWRLFFRFKRAIEISGFSAHRSSISDVETIFEGFNRLGANSSIRKSELGLFSYIEGGAVGRAKVGRFCSIGPGALVGAISSHPLYFLSTHPLFYSNVTTLGINFLNSPHAGVEESKETVVGNDVWIGARAIIFDGVRVGDGAVIAAGAVINKNVEPYSIVGGVPGRHLRYRFSQEKIDFLLRVKWWSGSKESVVARTNRLVGLGINVDSATLSELEAALSEN